MIGPFGRQGLVATIRQHCPQMTRRRCKLRRSLGYLLCRAEWPAVLNNVKHALVLKQPEGNFSGSVDSDPTTNGSVCSCQWQKGVWLGEKQLIIDQ